MELFLEAGQSYAFLLELIVDYLKLTDRNKVKLIHLSPGALLAIKAKNMGLNVPSLVTNDGQVEVQIFQICKRLFEILPQWKAFFLGEGEESTEISQIKTQLKEGKELRKHLQKHLESRTFFVGSHLTFADFYMFTQLYDNLLEMTDEQKLQYNNLFRWYKHIQNMAPIKEYLVKTHRFLIEDPAPKYPFLAEKKKPKKEEEKKEEKGDRKEEKKEKGEKKEEEKGDRKEKEKKEKGGKKKEEERKEKKAEQPAEEAKPEQKKDVPVESAPKAE